MTKWISSILCLSLMSLLAGCGEPNQPPTARIVSPALNDHLNEYTITFQAESSDDSGIASAMWYFGDGQQEPGGDEVTHTYAQGGQYTARYTVLDEQNEEATSSVTFTINHAPRAAARAQISRDGDVLPFVKAIEGPLPLEVQFQGSASRDEDGEIASYSWDFGDGNGTTDVNPNHIYNQMGDFEATLTVTDNEGKTSVDRIIVSVSAKPLEITDLVEPTEAELPPYQLIRGSTIGTNTVNKTVLFTYELTSEGPFSEEEIRLALLDIVLEQAQAPDISRATVYLFTEAKEGFMEPVDYDHYLGLAIWDRPTGQLSVDDLARNVVENTQLGFNEAYLSGEAQSVLGYEILQSELDSEDPRCTICEDTRLIYTILILNPLPDNPAEATNTAPLCRQDVDRTIQVALQRALQAPAVYGLNIFEGQFQVDDGVAVGLWSPSRTVNDVDTNNALLFDLFSNEPENWDLDSDNFKLRNTRDLPQCEESTAVAQPENDNSTPFIQGNP